MDRRAKLPGSRGQSYVCPAPEPVPARPFEACVYAMPVSRDPMTLTTDSKQALSEALGADRIELDVALGPMTTFRIGGPADLLYRARTPDELALAVQTVRKLDVPHFLLGRGANILVGDGGFRGLVIRSEVGGIEFLDDERVLAGAGIETFPDLIDATVARGLGGLHHYVGIPSTVGGALWQNLHFLSPAPDRVTVQPPAVRPRPVVPAARYPACHREWRR